MVANKHSYDTAGRLETQHHRQVDRGTAHDRRLHDQENSEVNMNVVTTGRLPKEVQEKWCKMGWGWAWTWGVVERPDGFVVGLVVDRGNKRRRKETIISVDV